MIAGAAGSQVGAQGEVGAGPPYDFTTEIMHNNVIPLKDAAMIRRTLHGYVYISGQQDNHLVVRPVKGGLRFVDTGTARWKSLPLACRKKAVKTGIAAVCRIPNGVTASRPMLLEIWPRLGDDYVDGSRLPATIAMSVLADAGNDVVRVGAGPDFVNGAAGNDKIRGGAGDDWIRGGKGNDRIWGGPGDDDLVGIEGNDIIYGGEGDDRLVGLADDTVRQCERVDRR
jgi:serralysin